MQPIKVTITGLEPTLRKLRNVQQSSRKSIMRKAVGAAGKVVLAEMRSRAPVSDPAKSPELIAGLLKKSLAEKVKVYPSGTAIAIVGPQTKQARDKRTKQKKLTAFGRRAAKLASKVGTLAARKQNPSAYAHLAGPGRKQRFMDEAASSTAAAARDVMIETINAGILDAWGA